MSSKRKRKDPDEIIEQLAQRDTHLKWWLEIRTPEHDAAIDRDVERSCERKDRYETAAKARAIAAMNGMAEVLHVYECRYCLQWHLTRRRT